MEEQNQGKSSEEVVNLLLEQKYQEAIPILDALIEEYPSHEEYSVYRSLVLRILIAHWTLSRISSGHTNSGRAHRLRKSLVGVFQFSQQKLIRSLRELYKNLYHKQTLRITVLSCAIVIMLVGIQEGNNVKSPNPRQTSNNRDKPQSTMLPAQPIGRPLTISTGEAADDDSHPNRLRTGSDETPSSPATSNEADNVTISADRKLRAMPNNQPQNLAASKSKTTKAHIAKAPTRNGASNKQQPTTVVSRNNESALASADEKAENNNGAAILDEYRSARPIGLRKSPSFAAEAIGEIHTGESLDVKEFTGSWAKVRLKPSGAVGFVRRELLVPITKNDGTAKGKTDGSPNTANIPAP